MGYYPDMSSQAAAQSYFEELVQTAISRSSVLQRYSGGALYFDVGIAVAPATGSVSVTPNLGGRGLVAGLATWFSQASPGANAPHVETNGPSLVIHNDNATATQVFWVAFAA